MNMRGVALKNFPGSLWTHSFSLASISKLIYLPAAPGSSGTVWASESVRLWHSHQFAIQIKPEYIDSPGYSKSFGTLCTTLHDCTFQFQDMTVDDDLDKLHSKGQSKQAMENAKEYERKRISRCYHILKNILDQKGVSNQFQNDEEVLFQTRIKPYIDEILKEAQYEKSLTIEENLEMLN